MKNTEATRTMITIINGQTVTLTIQGNRIVGSTGGTENSYYCPMCKKDHHRESNIGRQHG